MPSDGTRSGTHLYGEYIALGLGAALLMAAAVGAAAGTGSALGKAYPFNIVAAVAFTGLGWLIAPRQPHNMVSGLFVAVALASALVVISAAFSSYQLLAWVNQWTPVLTYGLLPLLLLMFPDGRLPSPAWRPVATITVVGLIVAAGGIGVAAWEMPDVLAYPDAPRTPLAIVGLRVARAGLVALILGLVSAVVSLVVRFRRSSGDTRQQLKWLAAGGGLAACAVVVDITGVPYVAEVVAATAIPASVTLAILKYKLYDIDLFLNRSLVYAVLSVLVVGGYVAVVSGVEAVLVDRVDWAPPVVAAAIVALGFQPLREWIQRRAERLLYGDRDDPYAVLSRLGRRLEQSIDRQTVLSTVVEGVTDALQLPYAAIELSGPSGDHAVASHGRGGVIEPERFPLSYQGQVVGTLLVSPRSSASPFSRTERRLLADLARQIGLAAHALRLADDLQRSRDRLVRSQEEERRRLRRDLHDGLGPALAGMTMQIGAARGRLPVESGAMHEMLGRLEDQLQDSVVEIRRLIENLRPLALDDDGLVDAVRRRLDAFVAADALAPTITIDASGVLGELPAAVELAAYRIATEAVTNAVRHAKASHLVVRISRGDELVVEVVDDGVGLAADHHVGVGLASMRERSEEIGGTLRVEAAPGGGTQVTARLPLGAS